jgi:hypothetical protein
LLGIVVHIQQVCPLVWACKAQTGCEIRMQSGPYLQATEPVHPPNDEQRNEASIYVDLCEAAGAPLFGSGIAQRALQGTVVLPHGWGHQHATGLSVASRTSGVNVNLLAADGPDEIERVSGMAHLTGIPVEVSPAAGPHAEDSWSGIAQGG